ncbi:MAG: ribonuclease [Acidobacteriaceae bacterium]|nr:ribonuclease [Acidobacteriaceae bacterium]
MAKIPNDEAQEVRQTATIPTAVETTASEVVKPIEDLKPVVRRDGLGAQIVALVKYMARSEVHTYAFSVAANAILSLFPFIVLLLTICRRVLHSHAMEGIVADMMRSFLPTGQDFVIRNMQILAHPQKGTQIFSVVMLLISSTGVFLPLEVALNDVWGVKKNRSYLHNQAVSLGLAFAVGVLAMISVASTAGQTTILGWVFFGHIQNAAYLYASHDAMRIFSVLASILLFFLIYWVLPFRKVPARAVLPTAIVIGLLWEVAKNLYVMALPWLDFQAVYGPFYISVGLMMWAFLSGLLLLAGAHFSATRYTLRLAREAEREKTSRSNASQ